MNPLAFSPMFLKDGILPEWCFQSFAISQSSDLQEHYRHLDFCWKLEVVGMNSDKCIYTIYIYTDVYYTWGGRYWIY